MAWEEYVGNAHVHTPYSDGTLYHVDIARAALTAGLDFVVVTDHNVWVREVEGIYSEPTGRRLMLLTGEEVHDVRRRPQVNHLLVYGADAEVAQYATHPQRLIDAVRTAGGFCFLAHPFEKAAPRVGEPAINWVDWEVSGFVGLEIWNYMSEFKSLARYWFNALRYARDPAAGIRGPFPPLLALWDKLLLEGRRVAAIGGADAHGRAYRWGPWERVIFPYEYLFRAVNTHVLTPYPFSGEFMHDRAQIYDALRHGHAWVGYDLIHPTEGFRFSGQAWRAEAIMGDELPVGTGATLQVRTPVMADIRLVRHGYVVKSEERATNLTHITSEPGAYRAEVFLPFRGRRRGWIFSNPIYLV
jgi:hypothetical protein